MGVSVDLGRPARARGGGLERDRRRHLPFGGDAGRIGAGIYAASERGLRAAFDALRLELAPAGVNVSYVMPGMFDTEGLTIEVLVFDGDPPPDYVPWFAGDGATGSAADLANIIAMVIGLPDGLCISGLVVRPTRQLNP